MAYTKFNFIFFLQEFNGCYDYYDAMLYDAYALSNVRAIKFSFKDENLTLIPYRPSNNPYAFSDPSKFNSSSPTYFADDFPTKNPLVFFTWANNFPLLRHINFFAYMQAIYPDCKFVCLLTNPAHFYRGFLDNESARKDFLSTFDCVLTYNLKDTVDYGLTYFENLHSVLPFEKVQEEFDIFYVGRPKERLKKILRAYETFTAAGFSCDFYINDISNPPPVQGIHFNQYLFYPELMKHTLRSRAILDITQRENYGLTLRYFESLAYNKIFITDNAFYRQKRFDSPKIFFIDKSYELDREKFTAASKLPNNYRNEYSSLRLISFLESELNS